MPPDYPLVPDVLFSPEPIAAVQRLFGPGWLWVAEAVTHIGSGGGILLLYALAFWLKGRRLAYGVVAAAAFGLLVSLALWLTLGVPRPDAPSIQVHDKVPVSSFPSGHVTTTVMIWGFLAARGHLAGWLVGLMAALSVLSRLYLGVHYLADVLAGLLLGAALLTLFLHGWPPIADWLARRPYGVYLWLGVLAVGGALAFIPFAMGNPHREIWGAIGWAIGGVVASLVEYRYVHFVPARLPTGQQVLKLAIGLGGFIPVALLLWFLGSRIGAAGWAIGAALAALWAALAAPWLFARRGWSRPARVLDRYTDRQDQRLAA